MEVLTVLQLVIDCSFEVKSFDQGRLMQDQRVSHAVDVDAFGRHPDTQLWYAEKKTTLMLMTKTWSKNNKYLKEEKITAIFTWMFLDSTVYDLSDILEGLIVVLQAVISQGDVVGQRWK